MLPGLLRPAAAFIVRGSSHFVHRFESRRMCSLLQLVDTVIGLYIWALIIAVLLTWLVQFNVVNTRNRIVYLIGDFLARITEPVLMPIRRILPDLGGIDVSPIVLILLLHFGSSLMWEWLGGACRVGAF